MHSNQRYCLQMSEQEQPSEMSSFASKSDIMTAKDEEHIRKMGWDPWTVFYIKHHDDGKSI